MHYKNTTMEEDLVLVDLAVAPVALVDTEQAEEEGEHFDANAEEAKDNDSSSISSNLCEDIGMSTSKETELNECVEDKEKEVVATDEISSDEDEGLSYSDVLNPNGLDAADAIKEIEDATDKISSDEDGGLSDSEIVKANGRNINDTNEIEDATDKISSDEDGGLSDSNVANANGLAVTGATKENTSPPRKSGAARSSPPRRRRPPASSPSLSLSRSPSKSPGRRRRGSGAEPRPKASRPQKARSRSRSGDRSRPVAPRRRPRFSRSRSRSKSPANHMTRRKHHDLPRYDVRHVISERREKAKKDAPARQSPRGNKSKNKTKDSRVVARGRRKSSSSSDSSRSRSRSRSPCRNGRRSRSKSARRSRSKSFRKSPTRSRRRSRSRSPRSRSRSNRRSLSRSSNSPQKKKKASKKRSSSKSEKLSQKKTKRKATTTTKSKKSTRNSSVPIVIPDHSTSLAKRNRGSGLPHAEKAVYESGDKILVSVTFNNPPKNKKAKRPETKEPSTTTTLMDLSNQKPAAIIDIRSDDSPYQIIEASPKEMIDLLSDDDAADAPKPAADSTTGSSQLRGPCTPPLHETIEVSLGPMTPSDSANPYDPCSPTESPRDASWTQPHDEWESPHCSTDQIPFVADDAHAVTTTGQSRENGGDHDDDDDDLDNDNMDLVHDMDSPSSPQGSDFSDIFEPPSSIPSASKKQQGKQQRSGKSSKKDLFCTGKPQLKVTDNKLRIVDEVPTSAVEMKVKDKYLKKVQRQERIVDEIKSVLKPFYNKKRISKGSYKEIMRKCVPKVCHSKNGEINTGKIQKLVTGYVRKYHYAEKRATNESK